MSLNYYRSTLCWEFWFPSLPTWGTDLLWMGWFPYLCGCPCLLVLVCSIKPSLAAYHPYHCLRCCLRLDSSTNRPETKIWVQEFGRWSQEARAWEMRAKRGREPRQCWLMRLLLRATGVQSQQGPLRDYAEYARVVLPQPWGAKTFTTQLRQPLFGAPLQGRSTFQHVRHGPRTALQPEIRLQWTSSKILSGWKDQWVPRNTERGDQEHLLYSPMSLYLS